MKKILITLGYKKRELNYLSLLAYFLERAGFEVRVQYTNFELYTTIFIWQPDFIILGQVNQNENVAIAQYATSSGSQVIVLNCEGTYNRKQKILRFGSNIDQYASRLFAWGDQHSQDAVTVTDLSPEKVVITGTPKFDWYKQPFYTYFKQLRPYAHRVDPHKKTICIATSLAAAEAKWEDVSYNIAYQGMGKEFFNLRVACQKETRRNFVVLAKKLIQTGKYNIIFRVHPLESQIYYRQAFKHYPIILDYTISPVSLFSSIDLLIHRSSTLATEAWITQIPTITIDPVNNRDKDILEFTTYEQVYQSIIPFLKVLKTSPKQIFAYYNSREKQDYVKNWYGFSIDDQKLSSKYIADMLQNMGVLPKRRQMHLYILFHLLLNILKILMKKKYIYEVIALLKGRQYLTLMDSLYFTNADIGRRKTIYGKIYAKA